jgi:hypothetical protein
VPRPRAARPRASAREAPLRRAAARLAGGVETPFVAAAFAARFAAFLSASGAGVGSAAIASGAGFEPAPALGSGFVAPVSPRSAIRSVPSCRTWCDFTGWRRSATIRSAPAFDATRTPVTTSSVSGKRVSALPSAGSGPRTSTTNRGGPSSVKLRTPSGVRERPIVSRRPAPIGSTRTSRTVITDDPFGDASDGACAAGLGAISGAFWGTGSEPSRPRLWAPTPGSSAPAPCRAARRDTDQKQDNCTTQPPIDSPLPSGAPSPPR